MTDPKKKERNITNSMVMLWKLPLCWAECLMRIQKIRRRISPWLSRISPVHHTFACKKNMTWMMLVRSPLPFFFMSVTVIKKFLCIAKKGTGRSLLVEMKEFGVTWQPQRDACIWRIPKKASSSPFSSLISSHRSPYSPYLRNKRVFLPLPSAVTPCCEVGPKKRPMHFEAR